MGLLKNMVLSHQSVEKIVDKCCLMGTLWELWSICSTEGVDNQRS